MNLCRNGHDKDVVGIEQRRDGKGGMSSRCVQCVKDSRAKELETRRAKRAVNPKRRRTVSREEKLERRRLSALRRRRAKGIQPKTRRNVDGFEDEYGPIPPRVPNNDWIDWVVVVRMLEGVPVGRYPTKPEWAEFFAKNKTTTFREVLHATGVAPATVAKFARANGYTWPYELTANARSRKE